jgi:membrane protein implicated in regulation of membrane protease activity
MFLAPRSVACSLGASAGSAPYRSDREDCGTLADQKVVGKVGRITGTIRPGEIGEVMIEVRGGSEAYHAYSADKGETLSVGDRVVVIEHFPPRTVVVTPM